MFKIKNILSVIIAFAFFAFYSCKNSISDSGEIMLKNGMDENFKVAYTFKNIPSDLSFEEFSKICLDASEAAKSECKIKGSFIPKSLKLIGGDTIVVSVQFTAQNVFGVRDFLTQNYCFTKIGSSYKSVEIPISPEDFSGESVYTAYCQSCHGVGGANGAGGLDLTVTQTDHATKLERIKNGASSMPGFKDVLNEKEIEAVTAYVESLKK